MTESQPPDVFLSGLLFADIVFSGMPKPPTLGTETWTRGMDSGPGGIANFAVALRRLGLRTALAAAFGADMLGDYCWAELAGREGVDLSGSRRFPGWRTPVTVSLAYDEDRALVTHGQPPPLAADELVGQPPASRAAAVHIGEEPQSWLARAQAQGTLVFADLGWDPSGSWAPEVLEQLSHCHAFLPNAGEAMRYTATDSPAAALTRLAELVPVAVVTLGPDGALAIDNTTGESDSVRGLPVTTLDPTGAGDVFGAAFIFATLANLPLAERLRFANLAAALSVQRLGGAMAAPGWADIAEWWRTTRAGDPDLGRDYAFLNDCIPDNVISEGWDNP
ncbi:carbohydrate kinase family protein [Phytohabitans rumicis]|uniref:Carbohydrate kinase n=1 Tax=Phytohabitans rumicis TaxID=1076125 RepID=A0A6V8L3P3_9ACTN|nr:carbohydrate kinase family protein [Phytohabitans rumicis]GFJ89588.1 carbohydrate kinase [Phytohabitans rumicis]